MYLWPVLNYLRHSYFSKILWGLMGIFLLNISVDTKDPNPQHIAEDLSFNDQESVVEIVVEKLLGYDDAIKEYDDPDTEDHGKEKNVKVDVLIYYPSATAVASSQSIHAQKCPAFYDASLASGFIEIDSPPPQV